MLFGQSCDGCAVADTLIDIDPKAAAFVRAHGGRLYVWIAPDGLQRQATAAPPGIDFCQLHGGEIALFVDREIEPPPRWRVTYQRLPRPHVRALWGGGIFSPAGARISSWEGDVPWRVNDQPRSPIAILRALLKR